MEFSDRQGGGGREPRILFLSGDVDIPWSSVMRRVLEHGFHGLHGCFLGDTDILC